MPSLKHGPRSLICVRVIGRTKPRGVMKVKGGRPGVFGPRSAPSGADPRPAAAAEFSIPERSQGGARGESLFLVAYLRLCGRSVCMVVRLFRGKRLSAGGRPELGIRRRRANLLLASPALLGLSVGAPRVGLALGGGFGPRSGSFRSVLPSDPALFGVA